MLNLSDLSGPMGIYFWFAVFNAVLGGLGCLLRKTACARIIWTAAVICWTIQALCYYQAFGTSSLSRIAPASCLSALVLSVWQWRNLKADTASGLLRPCLTAFFIMLLAMGSLLNESFQHDSFMMGYIFAKLFFLSRPLSFGLTLFALAGAWDACFTSERLRAEVLCQSRQAALLGGLIFLGGEISGCFWGFMGWGTTWRWSGNFYFSAMLFVLYMVALHVPRSVFSTAKAKALGFFSPLAVISLAMTLSKVMNL